MPRPPTFNPITKFTSTFAIQGRIEDHPLDVTDPDYEYAEVYEFDVSQVEPLLGRTLQRRQRSSGGEYAGTAINQAFIGTCTGAP